MSRRSQNSVTVGLGIERSAVTPPEHNTQKYPFFLDWAEEVSPLLQEPTLEPHHFAPYFSGVDVNTHDPYNGERPSFPRTRRFFLNAALRNLEPKVDRTRQEALAAHYLTSAIIRGKSPAPDSIVRTGDAQTAVPSPINGEVVTVVGPRVSGITEEVIAAHRAWKKANMKSFTKERGVSQAEHDLRTELNAHPEERNKRYALVDIAKKRAEVHKKLLDKQRNRQAKINRINERI